MYRMKLYCNKKINICITTYLLSLICLWLLKLQVTALAFVISPKISYAMCQMKDRIIE